MTVFVTDAWSKAEVITSVQRRRRWSAAEKVRIVEEIYTPDALVSLSPVARVEPEPVLLSAPPDGRGGGARLRVSGAAAAGP
jgi:hypothetical protein